MDNPWIKKCTVKTFFYITTISQKRIIIYTKSSKTQLENEMQNVVASSGGKRHVNASSFSVYGFQCFVYCFPFFCFSKPYRIAIKNVRHHLRLALLIFRHA